MYRNGYSSLPAKKQAWPYKLLHFLLSRTANSSFFFSLAQKRHLQHILSAVATNILRFVQWRTGTLWAQTRISRFAALAA
jgi:hypothetical protein